MNYFYHFAKIALPRVKEGSLLHEKPLPRAEMPFVLCVKQVILAEWVDNITAFSIIPS